MIGRTLSHFRILAKIGEGGMGAATSSTTLVMTLFLSSLTVNAASAEFRIEPGPTVISEEEKAIAPDASAGSEHGVVLLEETELDDRATKFTKVAFHLRAKILSNEGRDLANLVIPFDRNTGRLVRWWGRTLLSDGTVLELEQDELSEQTIVRFGRREVSVLKGALPGVAPGCVIDYGYTIRRKGWEPVIQIPLERRWPMLQFRYRWLPWDKMSAHYYISRAKTLAVSVVNDERGVLVTGENLRPVVDEPWAPPDDQIRATAMFYYGYAKGRGEYWNSVATVMEKNIETFITSYRPHRDFRPFDEVLETMNISPGTDLTGKLRTAYGWLTANLTNTSLRAWEASGAEKESREKKRSTAHYVLLKMQGNARQLDYLFIGLARALGARADLVLVVDRRERSWAPELLSVAQFDSSLVAVRSPGDSIENAILVDPGSGLLYGEVPWWYAGTTGLLVKPTKKYQEITVWPSEARQNVSDSQVKIDFEGYGGAARVHWSRGGKGQHGLLELQYLRRVDPEKRRERLDGLCGSSDMYEVSRAEANGLEKPMAEFRLTCEGELTEGGPDEINDDYYFQIEGPWIEEYPEFTTLTRVHPVVLPFRCVDLTMIDVAPASGFVTVADPAPIKLESPFGRYYLSIKSTSEGYHVERMVAFLRVGIPPEEYEALREFLNDVRSADKTYLQFRRAEK